MYEQFLNAKSVVKKAHQKHGETILRKT